MIQLFTKIVLICLFIFPGLIQAEDEYWEYTFRPGDSIWNIAKEYTDSVNNWSEIQRINEIRQGKDRKIRPGTRIVIPIAMLKQQPVPAVVIAINGDVSLTRANGQPSDVKVGTKLYSGDMVTTADKQSIRVQFADNSELLVNRNSEVVLDKLSHHKQMGMVDTKVRLNSGSVNTRVEKQRPDSNYEIRTPAAITAVRGTEFRLSTDDQQVSRTEVTEGIVSVAAGDDEKSVQDGYGIVAEKGKPLPEPVKLLSAPEISAVQVDDKYSVRIDTSVLEGATSYRYQIATDKDFNTIFFDEIVSVTSLDIDDLAIGKYFLRIRGIDKHNLEGVDSTTEFDISEVLPEEDFVWVYFLSWAVLIILL
jgi:hypothetical protein